MSEELAVPASGRSGRAPRRRLGTFGLQGSPSAPQILNQMERPNGRKQPHLEGPSPDPAQFDGAEFSCVGIATARQGHGPPRWHSNTQHAPEAFRRCPPGSSLSPEVVAVPRSWGAEYWSSLGNASHNYLGLIALFLGGGGKLYGRSLGLWTPICMFLFTRNP